MANNKNDPYSSVQGSPSSLDVGVPHLGRKLSHLM